MGLKLDERYKFLGLRIESKVLQLKNFEIRLFTIMIKYTYLSLSENLVSILKGNRETFHFTKKYSNLQKSSSY